MPATKKLHECKTTGCTMGDQPPRRGWTCKLTDGSTVAVRPDYCCVRTSALVAGETRYDAATNTFYEGYRL